MDATAIKQIQDTAADVIRQNQLAVTQTPVVALPESVKVHNLEPFHGLRSRFRGAFSTADAESFATNVGAWDGSAPVFVDARAMSATAIFNLGDLEQPGHADHTAALKLDSTAAFKALTEANGEHRSQRELAEWMEDWAEFITVPGLDIKKAIAAIRRVQISATATEETKVADMSESRSTLEQIDAKSGDAQLPSLLTFTCEPYHGLPAHSFECRIALIRRQNTSLLVLRIRRLEHDREQIARAFKELIATKLPQASIFVGTFKP